MHKSLLLKYLKQILLILFLSYLFVPCFSGITQTEDSTIANQRNLTAEELIRGERLFFGLVYPGDRSVNCAACHNTRTSDTLNWNPDAIEISLKYAGRNASDLSRILLNPSGQKMALVHKDFQITPEDIVLIKAYMDKLPEIGLKKEKPVITNLVLFIIASLLLLFSITDLIISKKIKRQWVNGLILTISAIYITWALVVDAIAIGRSPDYSPDQPIKFSHAVHAGQNQTDCIYCHSSAPYSKTAGIPAENVCMNCHLLVRNGTRSGQFEIARVIGAYENNKPIEWTRVYNLPDHVFFSHAQHVSVGGVTCDECHGPVEKMDRIIQISDLSMGWCINCHRTRVVKFDENKFYTEYKELAAKIRSGEINRVTVENIGGTECMKCHY